VLDSPSIGGHWKSRHRDRCTNRVSGCWERSSGSYAEISASRGRKWARPPGGRKSRIEGSKPIFYFDASKIEAANQAWARKSNNAADYPVPELSIEVDLSAHKVDRAAIYASIGVREVWRFDGDSLVIQRLNETGGYEAVPSSGFLPLSAASVRRWVVEEDATDRLTWEDRLAGWARSMGVPST
jgi:Uma2 family endonuclease